MEKIIRDGKVAVLTSPNYGAGWYSWYPKYKELLFHPKLIEMVENNKKNEIDEKWIKDNLGIDIYCGGACDLKINWLLIGTPFKIEECNGNEKLITMDDSDLIIA